MNIVDDNSKITLSDMISEKIASESKNDRNLRSDNLENSTQGSRNNEQDMQFRPKYNP